MARTSSKFRDEKRRITGWLAWWWKAGPRAREIRTQVQLAKALGVTKARITQVFSDENPGIDLLLGLWRATGYPLEVLADKDPPAIPDIASLGAPAGSERRARGAGHSSKRARHPGAA